jgi:hypothetical protein
MQPITTAQNLLALKKDGAITMKIEALPPLEGAEGHRPAGRTSRNFKILITILGGESANQGVGRTAVGKLPDKLPRTRTEFLAGSRAAVADAGSKQTITITISLA